MWAGVDVGGSRKGFHVALVDDDLRVSLERVASVDSCVAAVRGAAVVAVDAPAAWAEPGERSRVCERAFLAARVCRIRPTPDEVTGTGRADTYYEWIERGLALWSALQAAGVATVECFPTASWTRWTGARRGRNRAAWTRAGLAALGVRGAVPGNQDERDAVAAALTAWQCDRRPETVERFGALVVPGGRWPVPGR